LREVRVEVLHRAEVVLAKIPPFPVDGDEQLDLSAPRVVVLAVAASSPSAVQAVVPPMAPSASAAMAETPKKRAIRASIERTPTHMVCRERTAEVFRFHRGFTPNRWPIHGSVGP
jgi:hypothetical protein